MIAKEFLAALQNVRQSFEWRFVPDSMWQQERRTERRLRILATCRNGPRDFLFEPIGAVCYILTGHAHDPDAWIEAANEIELSLIAAGDLTAAANDRTWAEIAGRRKPDLYMQRLRKQLVASIAMPLELSAEATTLNA